MSWLKRIFVEDWWLKVLSLALAYALWAIVTQAPPVEIGMSVPLELRNLPRELQVEGEIPTRIHLHLRGPEGRMRRLAPEEVGVAVDMSWATPGNHTLRLDVSHVELPPGIEVVRIVPEEVRLELAPVGSGAAPQ
ncbi:MAG: CdaR family protein [Candidatus Acidiferrales bacterium]